MPKVKVSFNEGWLLPQIDPRTDAPVPKGKETDTIVEIVAFLDLPDARQGFVVEGRIKQKGFDSETLQAKVRAGVIEGLQEGTICDLFKVAKVTVTPKSRELPGVEASVPIGKRRAVEFQQQAKAGNSAMRDCAAAIDDLTQTLKRPFPHRYCNEMRNAFFYIASCTRASCPGCADVSCKDGLNPLRRCIENLAQRKDPNHASYRRTVQEMRGILRDWPVKKPWRGLPQRRPPLR
jgi:hypothetical protein